MKQLYCEEKRVTSQQQIFKMSTLCVSLQLQDEQGEKKGKIDESTIKLKDFDNKISRQKINDIEIVDRKPIIKTN